MRPVPSIDANPSDRRGNRPPPTNLRWYTELPSFLPELLREFQEGHPFQPLLREAQEHAEPIIVRALKDVGTRYLEQHGLRGVVDIEPGVPDVNVPEALLRSVFEHLVDGSLRENRASRPFCHIGVHSQDDGTVTLYVRDNGIALPESDISGIRDFLRRSKVAKTPDRVYRLFLAHNLIEWLRGSLVIGPTSGDQGACVLVRLPRAGN